jgi:hypothetical protein
VKFLHQTPNILQNYTNVNVGATINIKSNWKIDVDYTYAGQNETWLRPGTRFTLRNSWVAPKARVDASGNPVYVDAVGNVVPSTAAGAIKAFDLLSETYTPFGSNSIILHDQLVTFITALNAYTTYNLFNEDHALKFILGVNRVTATTEWQFSQITGLTNIENPQFTPPRERKLLW